MASTEPREAQPLLDDAGVVALDVQCLRCGYNLRGLRGDGLCPECAAPVGRSTQGDFLRFADPGWVRKLARGSRMIVAGVTTILVTFIVAALAFAFVGFAGASLTGLGPFLAIALALGGLAWLVSMICMYGGLWILTSPDPRQVGRDEQVTARKLVRVTVLVGLVGAPLGWLIQTMGASPAIVGAILIVQLVVGVVWVVGCVAYFYYLARLGERVPDRDLAGASRRLGVLGGVLQAVFLINNALMAASVFTAAVPAPAPFPPLAPATPTGATARPATSGPTAASATPAGPSTAAGPGASMPPAAAPTAGSPAAAAPAPGATTVPGLFGPAPRGGPLSGGAATVLMVVGCATAVAGLIGIVWVFRAIRLQVKLSRIFVEQAALAKAAWAGGASST